MSPIPSLVRIRRLKEASGGLRKSPFRANGSEMPPKVRFYRVNGVGYAQKGQVKKVHLSEPGFMNYSVLCWMGDSVRDRSTFPERQW
jgi:hypothetical protein